MIYCFDCKKQISQNAKQCPYCGTKSPQGGLGCFTGLVISVFLYSIIEEKLTIGIISGIGLIVLAIAHYGIYTATRTPPGDTLGSSKKTSPKPKDPGPSRHTYSPPPVDQYWEEVEMVPVRATLEIDYTNAKGEFVKRVVGVDRYDGSAYLKAFCNYRNDFRTFRIDRISDCVDVETGEVVDDVPKHLRTKYESTPEFKFEQGFTKGKDIINVLFYVAKADSQMRKPELEIIGKAVRKLAKEESITDEQIRRRLQQMPIPSLHAFKLAVGRIYKKSPKNLEITRNLAQRIVDTQKTVSPGEQEAMDYINRKLESNKT